MLKHQGLLPLQPNSRRNTQMRKTLLWDHSIFQCPLEDCEFTCAYIQPTFDHFGTVHDIQLPVDSIPFLTAFIYRCHAANDWTLLPTVRQETLLNLLDQQLRTRMDKSLHSCLFCRNECTIQLLFDHMLNEHGFYIGQLDNIVHPVRFLDFLRIKLSSAVCIYCRRDFRDIPTLRRHIRKRKHCRVDPADAFFDRFYLVNYAQPRVKKTALQEEEENDCDAGWQLIPSFQRLAADDSDSQPEGWSDWSAEPVQTTCLFDNCTFNSALDCHSHMMSDHCFDLFAVSDFYERIKLVNYIRKLVADFTCHVCEHQCDSTDELVDHFNDCAHGLMPASEQFKDDSNLIPFCNQDELLMLEDMDKVSR